MEDKYMFETINEREMDLVVNRHKLLCALDDFYSWYRELLNGKDYSYKCLCKGKVYSINELDKDKSISRDEYGMIKDKVKHIYFEEDILNRLEGIIYEVKDIIDRDLY